MQAAHLNGTHARLTRLASAAGHGLHAEIIHRLAQPPGPDFATEQPQAQPVLAEMAGDLRELRDMAQTQAEQSQLPGLTTAD